MIHDPEILILDEPTSGLDPNQIADIRDLIRELGKEKTVILSTHILPEVQATCDRVIIIADGTLVADDTVEGLTAGEGGRVRLVVTSRDGNETRRWMQSSRGWANRPPFAGSSSATATSTVRWR